MTRFPLLFLFSALFSFALLGLVKAHMELKYPAPRLSQYAGIWDYTQIDYDMNAPLNMKGNQLCQGKPAMQATATFNAGQSFTAEIVGAAPHGGGHCQFALSYDNGANWVVIADALRTCPLAGNYPVTIPATAPASDKVVFAWTWINAVGNREYYMNCADIIIRNPAGSGGSITGKKLLIANQPGYPTVPEFMGNLETGMDLINARPTITVRASGSTSSTPTPSAPTPSAPTPSTPAPSTRAPSPATQAPTPRPATTAPTPTTPTATQAPSGGSGSCKCGWAAYCGADSCGVIGANSACKCDSNSQCMGSPFYQCRKPGSGGAPVAIDNPVPTNSPQPVPTPGVQCKCLWSAYCGADTCGIQGTNSACQCGNGKTCTGGPYFQCR
jgi:hypothetical protein